MHIQRPLVWLLAVYLIGMGVFRFEFSLILITAFIGLCFVIVILWSVRKKGMEKEQRISLFFLLVLPFLFVAGYCRMKQQMQPPSMDVMFHNKIKGTVTGNIETIEVKGQYTLLTLRKNTITIDNPSENSNAAQPQSSSATTKSNTRQYFSYRVIIYTTSPKSDYKIGNLLSVKGQILKFQPSSNPGQFNEVQYYKTRNIDYKVNAENIKILDKTYSLFPHLLYCMKLKMIGIYQTILPPKDSGILSAMILGEMNLLDPEVKELYQQSGISHILSISGLNVSLLGIALFSLLRKIRIPLMPATMISICFIFSYGLLTNFSVSTNRAVVMLILRMLADVIGRTYDLLSATSLSAFIILVQSPMQIMNAGFLLSFTAILGISILYPVLSTMFSDKNSILNPLWLSLSIQVVTTPIILYYFYEFPVYSLLVNMLILPLSSILVLMATTSVIIGCFYLPFAVFLIASAHYTLILYENICRFASVLPYRTLLIGQPDTLAVIAYYSIIIVFLLINNKIRRKTSMILLLFSVIIFVKVKNVDLQVTFLDVGQGDGIFMEMSNGRTYLIDGGSADVKKVGEYRIAPFLKANGIWNVDYAIVTHPDTDHISGLIELIENMQIGDINDKRYLGKIIIRHLIVPNISVKEQALSELIALAKEKGIEISYMGQGDMIQDGVVTMTCLNPCPETLYSSSNAYSMVLSINYNQFDMLLTGDLEAEGEILVVNELKRRQTQETLFVNDGTTAYDVFNKRVTRLIQFRFPCSSL